MQSKLHQLWLIWVSIALVMLIAYRQLLSPEIPVIPLPQFIEKVEVIRSDATLIFTAHPQWQIDGKPAEKFGQWLALLPQACHSAYPVTDIELSEDSAIITLRFNDQETWQFSEHNSYSHSHYLIHDNIAYLCSEQLKPRLSLPVSYWQQNEP